MKAEDNDKVEDLLGKRAEHEADLAKSLHLNQDGSKSRAGGKRKRGHKTGATPAAAAAATPHQKTAAVHVQGKRGKVKVNVTIAGAANSKKQPRAAHKNQPKNQPKNRGRGGRGRGKPRGRGRG